jgi:hypothetical protein
MLSGFMKHFQKNVNEHPVSTLASLRKQEQPDNWQLNNTIVPDSSTPQTEQPDNWQLDAGN